LTAINASEMSTWYSGEPNAAGYTDFASYKPAND